MNTRRAIPLLIGLGLAVSFGCDTAKQDFQALGESITPVSPQKAARWMVDPHDPDNRRRGLVLISNSSFGGAAPYVAVYRDFVQYEMNPLVKAAALTALGRYGEPLDAPLVADALANESVQVRWAAARSLQRLHNPVVAPDLLAALRNIDEDEDVRMAVGIALGQYPQDRVFQGLLAALNDQKLSINAAAHRSLQTLTGEDFGLDTAAWLKWYDQVDDPFAGVQEYLYPTYQREESFMEKLAFWSSKTWEQPAPPAGLDTLQRQTYSDHDEPAPDDTGG